jgi:hypothetical protein
VGQRQDPAAIKQNREVGKMRQKQTLSEQGYIKGILLMVLLAAIVYVGIVFGQPYYRYNTLRSHSKDILSSELGQIKLIKEQILVEAAALNVPLTEDHLSVTVNTSKIVKVKGTWSETVTFGDYYSKKLDFELDLEQ